MATFTSLFVFPRMVWSPHGSDPLSFLGVVVLSHASNSLAVSPSCALPPPPDTHPLILKPLALPIMAWGSHGATS